MAAPFVLIIVAQALLGAFTLEMVSTLRAYVAGESLWSKGQHQAIYFLDRFVDTRDPQYIVRYDAALASPMGDRAARLALEQSPVDLDAAERGFAAAGNRPEDIPGLIWMFRYFSWFSYMDVAITRWRTAEQMVLALDQLAQRVFDDEARLADPATQAALKREIAEIHERITPLTKQFSDALGDGTRFVQNALALANIALAGVFVAVTLWRLNRFITQRRAIESELEWRATHDMLTGLPNRSVLEMRAAAALGRPGENALIFVDLDQFKVVNDTKGHMAGDRLLCRVAEVLSAQLRESDLMVRLGGDEFAVLLVDCALEEASTIAERLRSATQDLGFLWQGQAFSTTASIGLVHFTAGQMDLVQAMQAADMACYMAKEKGRNRVHLYAPDDSDMVERAGEMGWVQRLHRALERDRFHLYAQTIVSVRPNGGARHIEILVRLRDDDGELVPPGSFIPAAERFGLMPLLDRWVVRNCFMLLAEQQRKEGRPLPAICGINLSGTSINDGSFLPFLSEQFALSGIAPSSICFEITETSAIANLETAGCFMSALRKMGSSFALDDFGAGMASFGYLKGLPVDYLKIDGSFVRDMLSDRQDRAMVEMINHIGHMMGMQTIAEFVESPEILTALGAIGVDYAQGYAIGRPEPFDPARLWQVNLDAEPPLQAVG